jgi:hypothetical protein
MTMMVHAGLSAMVLAACAALAGCAQNATLPATHSAQDELVPSTVVTRTRTPRTFEDSLRDKALTQGRQGRLAEAALSWEILTVLRPDEAEYRARWNETRRLIDDAVPDHLLRAVQAHQRRDAETAASHYLAVLALQPDHVGAANALRAMERERTDRRRATASSPSLSAPARAAVPASRCRSPDRPDRC